MVENASFTAGVSPSKGRCIKGELAIGAERVSPRGGWWDSSGSWDNLEDLY